MNFRSIKLTASGLLAAILCLLSGAVVGAQAAGTAAPSQAVAALVQPFITPGAPAGCNPVSGQLSDCPLTARLRDRLTYLGTQPGGNPVGRTQNPPSAIDVALVKLDENATSANVPSRWTYGPGVATLTFAVVKQNGSWFVDDITCDGEASTSVYAGSPAPCPVVAAGAMPGMPVTGAADNNLMLPLALSLGALFLLLGVAMTATSRKSLRNIK